VKGAQESAEEMLALLERRVWLPQGLGKDQGATHEMLKQQVANLSEVLDCPCELEWPIAYEDRAGRIDVVFFRKPHLSSLAWPSHAFEIDYNPKRKSIVKLQTLPDTCQKWIVAFSPRVKPIKLRETLRAGINVYRVRRESHPYEP